MGTPITNTYITDVVAGSTSAMGIREDLTDVIARIDPANTPFYSNGTKASADSTFHEWLVQELKAIDTTAQPEGYDATFAAAKSPDRKGNYLQILAESWIVSGSLEEVDKAGRAKETVYQRTLKGIELRRNVEAKLLDNQIRDVTTGTRTTAGFITWITNGFWGTGGTASPPGTVLNPDGSGTDVAVVDINATPGTDVLTFDLIDNMLEDCYNQGGNPTLLQFTPATKRAFSSLDASGLAAPAENQQTGSGEATWIGATGLYRSDFGLMETAICRFQPGKNLVNPAAAPTAYGYDTVFAVDKRHYQIVSLPGRSFMSEPLAKSGDAMKGHVLFEGALRVTAPKAHGVLCVESP
jgi:hypothetical protein